jgi:hypothetical protein
VSVSSLKDSTAEPTLRCVSPKGFVVDEEGRTTEETMPKNYFHSPGIKENDRLIL